MFADRVEECLFFGSDFAIGHGDKSHFAEPSLRREAIRGKGGFQRALHAGSKKTLNRFVRYAGFIGQSFDESFFGVVNVPISDQRFDDPGHAIGAAECERV